MRLTCPNCAAQYEVPEDVIPPEGRDVQCSNCGQTWFQAAAGAAAAEAEPEPDYLQQAPEPVAEPVSAPAAADEPAEEELPPAEAAEAEEAPAAPDEDEATDAAEPEASDPGQEADSRADDGPEEDPADSEEDPGAGEDIPAQPRPRNLDPAMADILREEAEREASLRAAETQSLETQPDLGLEEAAPHEDEAARRSREARDRMARIRGEDPRQLAAAESGSRKELLPDIEEINSTLRTAGSAAPAPQAAEALPVRRKSGFARGFALSVIAALVLVMIYDNAPLISEKLPQAEPALNSYVGWVDQMRQWLDDQVKSLTLAE